MFNSADESLARPRSVKRKRVSVACKICRSHKIRCDGDRPTCGTCQRRREVCFYDDENNQNDSRSSEPNVGTRRLGSDGPGIQKPVSNQTTNEYLSGVTAMGLVSRPLTSDPESTGGFFGDSSTIAFIKQLQDTVKSRTAKPPQELSHQYSRQSVYQESPKSLIDTADSHELLPPRHLANHLVDCYFTKIHSLYPFVHKVAFLAAYESLWNKDGLSSSVRSTRGLGLGDDSETRTTFYYGLNVVFALACQFSDIIQVEREATSEAFFHTSKPALDVDYLEAGGLALTQTLLLMAHYLQGSRTPNRCWHVIGTACRLAQGIGLHSDVGNKHRSFAGIQVRRRVWHGCVMLDLYEDWHPILSDYLANINPRAVSTILGRPVMISHTPSTPLPEPIDDEYLVVESSECAQPSGLFSRVEWFIATLKLYDLLRKTLNTLYNNIEKQTRDQSVDRGRMETLRQIECITQIDAELQDFRLTVPGPLKWDVPVHEPQDDQFLRERCLLKASMKTIRSKLLAALSEQGDQQQDLNEQPDMAAHNIGQMPFPEDLFRDLAFDEQTFFDPFWYDLEF
ncbi:uncharacterized protein N7484_004430 [Penicillium longicatenatum]|uniref:uncharacterized protein n=1 Tax=Penicillium longicatenatum TaxID=1561947 RepID=UPI0025477526|nr:uncharacterized protein N7484_004430 [Penicillium longicatenatum]KAJ5650707.1 hypothetical protein N7484_004430 [Penicillium longicatenatum]